jgi:predicted ATPase
MRLASAEFRNFKSLEDVTLNFRDLTIIVGANATGKSNCLDALHLCTLIVRKATPPPIKLVNEQLRNKNKLLELVLNVDIKDNVNARYEIAIDKGQNQDKVVFSREILRIVDTKIIDIANGSGTVSDEDGNNQQKYESKEGDLALKTAGNFGNKPLTAEMSEFVRNWEFYDLDPKTMRRKGFWHYVAESEIVENTKEQIPCMDNDGEFIEQVLIYLGIHNSEVFQAISEEVESCLDIKIEISAENDKKVKILEREDQYINISGLSDGTLRIIGYCVLLHQDTVPTLIGIEEPERNLHPAVLQNVADLIKRLSEKTQVVITTHSSQLLDCFTLDEIREDISVLLLSKPDAHGTQIYQLDKLSEDREALADWMRDFGVGSAIYHSNLLEQICEPQYA